MEILEPSHYVYRQTLQTMRDAGIKVSQIRTGMYSLYHKKCSQVSGLVPVILGKVLMFNQLILHYRYFFFKSTKWGMFDKTTGLQKRTYTDLRGGGKDFIYSWSILTTGKIAPTIACFIYFLRVLNIFFLLSSFFWCCAEFIFNQYYLYYNGQHQHFHTT